MGQKAKPNPGGAESTATATRKTLLASGSATRAEGLSTLRSLNPDDFLGASAIKAMLDETTMTNFVPQLRQLQARNSRRGIRGPVAGAVEGDLASAFHRNIAGRVAEFGAARGDMAMRRASEIAEIGGTDRAQGISLLGTELELQLAREQAKREQKSKRLGMLGSLAGGVGGFLIGGPMGASIGARIGSNLG